VCYGEDGHIAIEVAGSECCAKFPARVYQAASGAFAKEGLSSENNCGACVDTPISIGLATIVKEPYRVNPAFSVPTTIALATVNSPGFSEYQSVSEPFTPTGYFTPLRSIILLI